MGNCLVTKLKGVVDNPDLEKIGTLRFELTVSESSKHTNYFHSDKKNTCKFSIISGPEGGTVMRVDPVNGDVNYGTEFFLDASYDVYYFSVPGVYVIEITNKYNITALKAYGHIKIDTYDIKYCPLREINLIGSNATGSFSDLVSISDLIDLRIESTPIAGDISDINKNQNFKSLIAFHNEYITGDLSSISGHQSLSTFATNGSNNITGKLSDIVNIPKLSNFQIQGNVNVTGSLADLLDNGQLRNPELSILVVIGCTGITRNAEDIATLRSLGVEVHAGN